MNAVDKLASRTETSAWKDLYRIGGVAALAIAPLYVAELAVFIAGGPMPTTVSEWFTLLQSNPLVGLVDLYLLEIPLYLMMGVMFLALYVALRRTNEAYMALATFLAAMGVVLFFALNPALSMLSLSNQYAAATGDAERAMLLAAGQAYLAMTQGTGFTVAFLLTTLAGLIASAVLWRDARFHKATAYAGVVTNVLLLALYVPAIGFLLWMLGGLILPFWLILVGWDLVRLGRPGQQGQPEPSDPAAS